MDAAAVYAAGNAFDSTLVLPGASELDRLPGHLPRTSPAQNEYLGSALFSGGTMTGTLTGSETSSLWTTSPKSTSVVEILTSSSVGAVPSAARATVGMSDRHMTRASAIDNSFFFIFNLSPHDLRKGVLDDLGYSFHFDVLCNR